MTKDTQSRKWQGTLNYKSRHDIDHEKMKMKFQELHVLYWCLADEIGLETQTLHTHFFIMLKSPVRFSRLKKLFPEVHFEQVRGSAQENRNYISKTGKWVNDEKADTSIEGTFEESGPLPEEPGQGARTDIAELYCKIEDGMTNAEIMASNPDLAIHISRMDKIRQDILEARYRDQRRTLEVTYIFGPTATGKTRGVMDEHGYADVYRVTDYKHPFDRYAQQPVLCFDEFRSSLMVGDMLDYLDCYPLALPARYAPRQACYETVYIISNIDLKQQFPKVQEQEPETWKAFLRRIHHVVEYRRNGPPINHGSALEYIFPIDPTAPDWVQEAQRAEREGEEVLPE
ncbi:hypothetical protein [Vermiculatibacterium agrestimuris]|uniref:hypothetical protein n=1 Tax=Vermiculatibacterium agrestimuris TaxID=2941519 RepID=UPI00203CE83B|nr:hypothetical protein [Vermiculatibacterium agrestimuris]